MVGGLVFCDSGCVQYKMEAMQICNVRIAEQLRDILHPILECMSQKSFFLFFINLSNSKKEMKYMFIFPAMKKKTQKEL